MTDSALGDLQSRIMDFARSTGAPEESFLMRRPPLDDADQVRSLIDGITLSLISYSYHNHPRGENVHQIMELLENVRPNTPEAADLERRADDAAALQIPFIVTLNRLVEDYYDLRQALEERLGELPI